MYEPADEVLDYMQDQQGDMVALLERVVEMESPSLDKATTDKLVDFLAETLQDLGCQVTRLPQREYGDHLIARYWPERCGPAPDDQLLVLCHIDTVWPVGEIARRPFRIMDGKAYGPGVEDMKGGVVQALIALQAFNELGMCPARPVVLIFNTDEEVGSPTSRPYIEAEARKSRAAFVLEPAVSTEGMIKTFRKGVGMFKLRVEGRAAHAGADHQRGVNAIEELAHQVIRIQGMTDYMAGTTLNVGVISGGSRSNVVPAFAEASVDCRVSSAAEGDRVTKAMLGLQPVNPATSLTVTGGLNRPPMERTPQIVAMFERARALAAGLGLRLDEAGTGGGSDGNFTAALGTPTLDGMGAVGDGGHAVDEYLILKFMPERATLLVHLLATT
jgi:glutamate carboxypeptidase